MKKLPWADIFLTNGKTYTLWHITLFFIPPRTIIRSIFSKTWNVWPLAFLHVEVVHFKWYRTGQFTCLLWLFTTLHNCGQSQLISRDRRRGNKTKVYQNKNRKWLHIKALYIKEPKFENEQNIQVWGSWQPNCNSSSFLYIYWGCMWVLNRSKY